MDAECMKCGEPWEVEEFEGSERNKFYAGKGCPACHWGKHCSGCNGTGAYVRCDFCFNSGYMIMRRLIGEDHWRQGYDPNVRHFDDDEDEIEIIEWYPREQCREGWVEVVLTRCVECGPTHKDNPCPQCNGTGKLQPLSSAEWDRAAWSMLESTDEDPIDIINEWDL